MVINTLSLHVHRADMLDTDGTESLDWAQVASFVAATSANSAIVGASDLDPDGVKASLHALDEDGNGTVSRQECHQCRIIVLSQPRVILRLRIPGTIHGGYTEYPDQLRGGF